MNMILGEIFIDDNLDNNEKIIYNKNKCIVNIKKDVNITPLLPSLIVGWNKAKILFEGSINILDKKIKNNLYWTFSPEEDKQDFNEDIESFINHLYNDLIKDVHYQYIDPVLENIYTAKEIINKYFLEKEYDNVYVSDNFMYVYEVKTKTILGLDFKFLSFLKINIFLIKESIKSVRTDYEDYSDSGIYQTYKKFLNKDIDKKYIPFLIHTAKNEINNI